MNDRQYEYVFVNLDELKHGSYQRTVSPALVEKIYRNYNPESIGILLVGRRSDRSLWLVDGNHRKQALMKSGVMKMKAAIFESSGEEEEARIFTDINSNRTPVKACALFNARLCAGDPACIELDHDLREIGYHIVKGGGINTLNYAACLMACRATYGRFVNIESIKLQRALVGPNMALIKALHIACCEVLSKQVSGPSPFELAPAVFKRGGRYAINDEINWILVTTKGRRTMCAEITTLGVLNALNKGRTESRKIVFRNEKQDVSDTAALPSTSVSTSTFQKPADGQTSNAPTGSPSAAPVSSAKKKTVLN